MQTRNSKQVFIKFRTKNSFYYIDERCLECVSRYDLREMYGSEFLNDDAYKSGDREVIITFDIEDVEHFKTKFKKSKIFKNVVSMRIKDNKPQYDEVFEYHMPCISVNILGQPCKHERYDREISFIFNRIKYNIHYCNYCYEHQSHLSYEYGHLTRLLHFIVNESGLFDDCNGKLYWHRSSRSKPCDEMKQRYDYELIFGDSHNRYYIKTRKFSEVLS